ncbi:hypothetical protein BCR44DRAFT_1426177 [Catenaria anguillulae PL171]|uniref:Alpha/Beta hydrolase protein n=1 Tax=Catenaria anguillulae PL171 TaxID=765915 RepID=A0A1Y2HZM9_9FUNG|nr:hypothetical protein BCR44DRAFT_1426177 [Catenaria anguillulae PL171]
MHTSRILLSAAPKPPTSPASAAAAVAAVTAALKSSSATVTAAAASAASAATSRLIAATTPPANAAATTEQPRKTLIPLTRLQLLTRLPRSNHREATVYVKGFLQSGEDPRNFDSWLQSHHLLALSPKHSWDGLSFGYSWNSGALLHPITLPVPLTTLGTVATRLLTLSRLTPAGVLGSLALDTTLNLGKLAWQFRQASSAAELGAPQLAETLRELRKECDHVRVVAHSLGCRHVTHAIALMHPDDRPDTVHLCAPAMTNQFFRAAQVRKRAEIEAVIRMEEERLRAVEEQPEQVHESMAQWGEPDAIPLAEQPLPHTSVGTVDETSHEVVPIPLAKRGTYVYWTSRDTVLALLFRAVALGDLAMGHIGVHPPPPPGPTPEALSVAHAEYLMGKHDQGADGVDGGQPPDVIHLHRDPFGPRPSQLDVAWAGKRLVREYDTGATLESIDVSEQFATISTVHTAYSSRFHAMAREYWHANQW